MRELAWACLVCVLLGSTPVGAQIATGSLMITEYDTGSVADISPGGSFAQTGRFATGLSGPTGLCFGPEGGLYVAEYLSGEVTLITFGGDMSEALPFAFGLGGPMALLCDSESVFVVEATDGAGEITDITAGGDFTGAPAFAAGLGNPVDLAVDFEDRLFVTDQDQGRIFEATGGGVFLSGTPYASGGSGTKGVSSFGELRLVANQATSQVIDFTLGGDLTTLPVFATVPDVVGVYDVPGLGLFAISDSQNSVYEISAGGDYTGQPAFASGLVISNGFAGIAHLRGCGDGILEEQDEEDDDDDREDCDDGNNLDGDGCSAECRVRLCLNPASDSCIRAASASLSISSKKEGREKLKATLSKFDSEVTRPMLGDPIFGNSRWDVCFYNQNESLVSWLIVDRAFDTCGPREDTCWDTIGDSGYRYKDVEARSSGVRSIVAKGGKQGRGSIKIQASNNARKNQRRMPTGIDNSLEGDQSATVQIMVDDGSCYSAFVGARKAEQDAFKGKR
jgi:hypothetical protein